MTTLIADVETNGFLTELDRLWTIQIGTEDGDDVDLYCDVLSGYRPIREGLERLSAAERLVMHNGLGFDIRAVNKVFPGALRPAQIFDTLVLARLMDPGMRHGHGLKAWGLRLGLLKGTPPDTFDTWDASKMPYARQDIIVTRALLQHLKKQPVFGWKQAIDLEHHVAWLLTLQEDNGFPLDIKAATALEGKLRAELSTIEGDLQTVFPPRWVVDKARCDRAENGACQGYKVPKVSRADGVTKGWPFTPIMLEPFNPGSRQQGVARLKSLGWTPKKFTDSGAPALDDEVLAELPYPQAKPLARYFRVEKMLGQVADGDGAWLKLVHPDGRIRGWVNTNGARTGRMTHSRPNTANVDSDPAMRGCWTARDGWVLVGCDAEGVQARALAHYLHAYDQGGFTKTLIEGDKSKGTDIHSLNSKAVTALGYGTLSRDGGKTTLYALIFGSMDPNLGFTVKRAMRDAGTPVPRIGNKPLGAKVRKAIERTMPGLDKLIEAVQKRTTERGYLIGLDGRRLPSPSKMAALNTILQGAEAVIMKVALVMFHEAATGKGWKHGEDFGYCANVHDEVQIESRPEIAEEVGALFAYCIQRAGETLKLRCPLAGAFKIGRTWAETH